MFSEIKIRYEALCCRCEIDPKTLRDYEILNLQKQEDNFNLELLEFMEKVSEFALSVLPCQDEADDLCKQTQQMRNVCAKNVSDLFNEVKKLILSKDIPEKKLKNTALLKMELPEFKGYHSSTDTYTF